MMNPYVLALNHPEDLVEEFKKIGVDTGGIEIMRSKGFSRIVKVHRLPCFWGNILKQEMLSLGGDVALSRGSITGQTKYTDGLVMGSFSQIIQLSEKLKKQPFGLSRIGCQIKGALKNFDRRGTVLDLAGKKIRLGRKTFMMGIINATPDSFSGDGIVGMDPERVFAFAQDMVSQGADMLDIGAESSRPGSRGVSVREELQRILPVLKQLTKKIGVPISVDTTKSEVAHAALDLGASIINDISALRFDKKMAKLACRYKACVVLVHMKGAPLTMQKNPRFEDVVGEVVSFLNGAIDRALEAGISGDRIIVDPGIGFGKTVRHNIEILDRLSELKSLGKPILVGISRKRFIGKILDADVHNRIWGTAAATSLAITHGADIMRVHDCPQMRQVIGLADAVVRKRGV
jgi:dihydropteroate synthase